MAACQSGLYSITMRPHLYILNSYKKRMCEKGLEMSREQKKKAVCTIQTSQFCKDLNLELIYAPSESFELYDTGINRPGLQLHGFYEYFDVRRIQTIGKVEIAYLMHLSPSEREAHIMDFMSQEIPCLIICWEQPEYALFEKAAQKYHRPLMISKERTTTFTYRLVDYIDRLSAPKTGIHGVLVEVHGVGVVITGDSGIGKSETALELIKRGNTFIADDRVEITCRHGNTLIGEAPELLRYFMEVRGIGIIDVRMLFGARSVKRSVEVEMMIHLENWSNQYAYDRLGLDEATVDILGVNIPKVVIPVSGGRNLAGIIEAAAINNRMKASGYHSAQIFCDRFDQVVNQTKEQS